MEDVLAELQQVIYEGNTKKAREATKKALHLGYSTKTIIEKALFPPMKIMGEKLRDGQIFIPEVLMASRAMHASMYCLQPLISHSNERPKGVVVIGTVAGDLHDIGKNLVSMLLSGKGFTVIDLGIDVTKEEFLAAIQRYHPDILAISALLTTTMPECKNIIDYIVEEGVRPQISIMVGGSPITLKFAKEIKADVYTDTMFEAAEAAEDLMAHRISQYAVK